MMMKETWRRGLVSALLVWVLMPAAVSKAVDTVQLDGYAAAVGSRIITVGEVMEAVQALEATLRGAANEQEYQRLFAQAYLQARDAMVEQALILEEFGQLENATIPERAVDQRIQAIIDERYEGSRAAFLADLRQARMSMEQYRQEHRDAIAVMIMRQQQMGGRMMVPPGEMLERYEAQIERFRQPGQVQLLMIVLPAAGSDDLPDPAALAEEIRRRRVDGEAFQELARAHSTGTRAERGGDWGWVNAEDYRAELRDAMNALQPGEISPPVTVGERIYLMEVVDRREEKVIPFTEAQEEIRRALEREREMERYQAWIGRLRDKYFVKLYDPPAFF